VVVVAYGHVPAVRAMGVLVVGMGVVQRCHGLVLSCAWTMASLTMWATWSSLSE
jgi:hypothetical protein